MKDDIPAVALRLSTEFPCRTHLRAPAPPKLNLGNRSKHRGRGVTVIFGKERTRRT